MLLIVKEQDGISNTLWFASNFKDFRYKYLYHANTGQRITSVNQKVEANSFFFFFEVNFKHFILLR